MENTDKIESSITTVIKDEKLQDVSKELAETGLDLILEDGVLKDIPIVGTIVGLIKASSSISDALFAKKIFRFLLCLTEVPTQKRVEEIEKIEKSSKYQLKVGEKLLFILDKCDDNEKSMYLGKMFASFLRQEISYEDFLRAAHSINSTFLSDLKDFIKTDDVRLLEAKTVENLIGASILNLHYVPGFGPGEQSFISDVNYKVSEIGLIIKNTLKN